MDGDMILYCVILLLVLFILIIPTLLYAGLKKIADPVPLYLPALLAAIVLLVLTGIRESGIISEGDTFTGTVISSLLLLLFVDLAVIAPFHYFEKKIGFEKP